MIPTQKPTPQEQAELLAFAKHVFQILEPYRHPSRPTRAATAKRSSHLMPPNKPQPEKRT